MNASGKTAYRLTKHGQVVVVDRRHLTKLDVPTKGGSFDSFWAKRGGATQ
jgi:hypothetical protein